jgi:hypothetical protein
VNLTRENVRLLWDQACQLAFEKPKQAFVEVLILKSFNWKRDVILETDSFDYASARAVSQYDWGALRPVAFFSKKLSATECKYKICCEGAAFRL